MIQAIAVLLGTVIACTIGPHYLHRLSRSNIDPRAAIIGWVVSIAAASLSAVLAVALLVLPSHGGLGEMVRLAGGCVSMIAAGSFPAVENVAAAAGLIIMAAVGCRLAFVLIRRSRTRRQHRDALRSAFQAVAIKDARRDGVLWVPGESPAAFSIGGQPRLTVATTSLRTHLSPRAVGATLAHERAHLRGRHHLLTDSADALAEALPFIPLFKRAAPALRELVEVAADVAAVRKFGAAAVIEALHVMSAGRHRAVAPSVGLGMARGAVEYRLDRLAHVNVAGPAIVRHALCGVVAVIAAAAPTAAGLGLLIAVACSTG